MNDSNLLFIASQPRSGSTLLQSIISNHDLINTTSEPWLLLPYLTVLKPDSQRGIYNSRFAKVGIEDFFSKYHIRSLQDLQKEFLLRLYSPLLENNQRYVLDKTPRYYEILPDILSYFPNAKVIVLKRDPFDVLQSIIETWKVKRLRHLTDYSRDILQGPYLLDSFTIENNGNPNIKELYYEDLVENPQAEISSIFSWLSLPFNENILDYKVNTKAKGKMGDKIGVNKYEGRIVTKSEKQIKNDSYLDTWSNFIEGYTKYLVELQLPSYKRYLHHEGKSTNAFNDYKYVSNLNCTPADRLHFKNLLFLIKYKCKGKFIQLYQ